MNLVEPISPETIIEKVKGLSQEKLREVLTFIEFLLGREPKKRSYTSLHGLWRGLDITQEEIALARREMWGTFPLHTR